MNFSPLLQGVIDRRGWPVLTLESYREFVDATPYSVLFFSGDWERLGESNDVAIILPEMETAFQGVFKPAVIDRLSERKLQAVYRFGAFPALVFLRNGAYLGSITRVLDWDDYLRETARILSLEPSDPPPFPLPGIKPAQNEDAGEHMHFH